MPVKSIVRSEPANGDRDRRSIGILVADVVIEIVGEAVGSVRDALDHHAGAPLAIVQGVVHGIGEGVDAEPAMISRTRSSPTLRAVIMALRSPRLSLGVRQLSSII